MEKTIESIWRDGSNNNKGIKTPTIEDLRKLKSQHVVDKFEMTFKVNIKAIFIGSLIFLLLSFLIETPYTGIGFFFLGNALALFNYKLMKRLYTIDKNLSGYDYLRSFNNWLDYLVNLNTKIHRFLYPLFVFFVLLGFWLGPIGGDIPGEAVADKLLANHPNTPLLFDLPFYIPVGLIIVMITLGLLAKTIYQWDFNIVYGRLTKKLKALIKELEELRTEVE